MTTELADFLTQLDRDIHAAGDWGKVADYIPNWPMSIRRNSASRWRWPMARW